MKRPVAAWASCMLLLFSPEGFSQVDAASVTDADVDVFKSGIDSGCRNRGREVGDPPEHVDAFCTCMLRMLNEQVSMDEWKRAVALAASGEGDEGMEVLTPYLPKLAACRPKPPA